MAHHKDAIKRTRTSEAARQRNRAARTRLRHQVKQLRDTLEGGDQAASAEGLKAAMAALHHAAGKGLIHRRNAARRISRLARQVNALGEKK
jgi:small subunit ribosomal protein S20